MSSNGESERNPNDGDRGKVTTSVVAAPALILPSIPLVADNENVQQHQVPLLGGTIAVETTSNPTSKLQALIIGINDYPSLSKLKGAVADADAIAYFLKSDLKVPPDQIINLRNDTATRQKIIESIKSLQTNPQISRGDPILIYYAGHGGVRTATDEWKEAKGAHDVQVIFPFDYDTMVEGSSDPIECIPDRTIAGLINELSQAKGDNVTVIFDSCHSASGTRATGWPRLKKGVLDRRERSAEVKRDIPWSIDSDIVPPELGVVPQAKEGENRRTDLPLCTNQTSHIHLAACGSEEKAYEEDGRGVFTVALLKSIRANGVDKISYHGLIKSLPIFSSQSPHCYGKHKGRILFDSGVPSRTALMIPVEYKGRKIVLQAGAASGVTTESIWEIYHSVTGEVPLGRFRAESPHASTTVLQPEESGGDDLYLEHIRGDLGESMENSGTQTFARQVRVGVIDELRVYFTPQAKSHIFPADDPDQTISYSVGSGKHDVGYVVHTAEDSADIAVDLDLEGKVSFRLCERQAEQYGVATLEKRARAERSAVEEVLFAAAKWKWHLQRKNAESGEITNSMTMELVTVGKKLGRQRIMCPEDERIVMNTSGITDFEVKRQDLYGIKLESQVESPLYVRMFYFDTTDFSIVDMFGHAVGKDPVIRPKQTFIIGDNADGGTPLQFMLNPQEKVDLGYMKVFWSTKPLELEGLGQKPVFNRVSRKWSRLRGCERDLDDEIEWGTTLLTMVQRSSEGYH